MCVFSYIYIYIYIYIYNIYIYTHIHIYNNIIELVAHLNLDPDLLNAEEKRRRRRRLSPITRAILQMTEI